MVPKSLAEIRSQCASKLRTPGGDRKKGERMLFRWYGFFALSWLSVCGLSSEAVAQPTQDAISLDQNEFERLHLQLDPQQEIWETIPWETSLIAAQRKAAAQDKLIFIWAMDGNPFGCT